MKLNITKIIRPLSLEQYDESYKDIELQVWLNPHRMSLNKSQEISVELAICMGQIETVATVEFEDDDAKNAKLAEIQERLDKALLDQREWWADILSKHKDPNTHWTAEEIEELDKTDVALWNYIRETAAWMIKTHREGEKKGLAMS